MILIRNHKQMKDWKDHEVVKRL